MIPEKMEKVNKMMFQMKFYALLILLQKEKDRFSFLHHIQAIEAEVVKFSQYVEKLEKKLEAVEQSVKSSGCEIS